LIDNTNRGQGGQAVQQGNTKKSSQRQQATARLDGSDHASAEGISVTSPSPVLTLCRKLIDAGYDPALSLVAYRGGTQALRIRSLGEGARLEVRGDGVGFRPSPKMGASPPMRLPGRAGVRHRAGPRAAP
jgi:hypothetical protein